MDKLLYLALLIPAVLMIFAGVLISSAKRDSAMASHHYAGNFNLKGASRKTMTLFTAAGLLFSLSGLLILQNHAAVGFALLFLTLIVFLAVLIAQQRKR